MLYSKLNIGEKDKLITIIQPVIASGVNRPSTNEDKISAWILLAEVWARVRAFKGDEAMIAERLTESHHVTAETNYRSDVTARMRFVSNSKVYAIVSIIPAEDRNRHMTLVGELLDNEVWT